MQVKYLFYHFTSCSLLIPGFNFKGERDELFHRFNDDDTWYERIKNRLSLENVNNLKSTGTKLTENPVSTRNL